MEFATQYNYVPMKGEEYTEPSLTVPDMTYTPREIISRFTRGLPISKLRDMYFTGPDILVPDSKGLDPVDRDRYLTNLRETVKTHYESLKEDFNKKQAERKKQGEQTVKPMQITEWINSEQKRLDNIKRSVANDYSGQSSGSE